VKSFHGPTLFLGYCWGDTSRFHRSYVT